MPLDDYYTDDGGLYFGLVVPGTHIAWGVPIQGPAHYRAWNDYWRFNNYIGQLRNVGLQLVVDCTINNSFILVSADDGESMRIEPLVVEGIAIGIPVCEAEVSVYVRQEDIDTDVEDDEP
jgi:hypothetical protein